MDNSGSEPSSRRAAIPVIDAHNHLWGDWNVEAISQMMDQAGVISCCDLTANVQISWEKGGYSIGAGDIGEFFEQYAAKYPGKFYCFTTASFARPTDAPLFDDAKQFVAETIAPLRDHVARPAS